MSENYTPSIDRLRSAYVKDAFNGWRGIKTPEQRQQTNAEFDRAIAAHDAELREQIVRDLQTKLPKQLADDSETIDGWLSDWDGQVWPAADDTRVDLTGDGSIDLDHIASHAVSIAQGKEQA